MISESFTAIDFETANYNQWSICQVGVVRIEGGKVIKEFSQLVQPPDNQYLDKFIKIHGISPDKTENMFTFDRVWPFVKPFITNSIVVAHSGYSFDFPVLEKTLNYYGLEVPEYQKRCTYRIYRKNLASLCKIYSIPLNNHDALSDARACAKLYQLSLNKQ